MKSYRYCLYFNLTGSQCGNHDIWSKRKCGKKLPIGHYDYCKTRICCYECSENNKCHNKCKFRKED